MLALYALIARVLFGDRLYGVFAVPTVAPFGPFVSKNHFAGYVEMACLLVLGLAVGWADDARRGPGLLSWIESRRAPRILLAFAVAAVLALGVLVSLSRGGAMSLSVGTLVFVGLGLPRRKSWGGRALVLGLVAIVALSLFLALPRSGRDRIRTMPQAADESAGAFRLRVWSDTLGLVASSPIVGSGLGAFAAAFPRFKSAYGELRVENAENDYLQVLAETGSPWTGVSRRLARAAPSHARRRTARPVRSGDARPGPRRTWRLGGPDGTQRIRLQRSHSLERSARGVPRRPRHGLGGRSVVSPATPRARRRRSRPGRGSRDGLEGSDRRRPRRRDPSDRRPVCGKREPKGSFAASSRRTPPTPNPGCSSAGRREDKGP